MRMIQSNRVIFIMRLGILIILLWYWSSAKSFAKPFSLATLSLWMTTLVLHCAQANEIKPRTSSHLRCIYLLCSGDPLHSPKKKMLFAHFFIHTSLFSFNIQFSFLLYYFLLTKQEQNKTHFDQFFVLYYF